MIRPIKSTLIDQKFAALGFLLLLFWLIQEQLPKVGLGSISSIP
jgi:hypothetical protein